MRVLPVLFAALAVTACATAPEIERVQMPVEILRAEGEPPRMGKVTIRAGGHRREDPFSFIISFDSDGETLGEVDLVAWSVKLDGYCRNRDSWVQSILIGPEGQVWRGYRVATPAGPDRTQYWSGGASRANGPGAVATPGLEAAAARGGRFTVAIEDDEGQRWNVHTFDALSPTEWLGLFKANQEKVRTAAPDMPVAEPRMLVARQAPIVQTYPPRSCPER